MATAIELVESRRGTVGEENPTVELIYMAYGTEDEAVIRALVDNTLPARQTIVHTRPGLGFAPIVLRTVFQQYDLDPIGGGVWMARAMYGRRSPRRIGDHTYNFDTGGGQQHITQSIRTVEKTAINSSGDPIEAPDYFGAINVDKNSVKGVSIGQSVYKWSETWYWNRDDITADYRRTLKALSWTVNNEPFREFDAGEVLFRGTSGIKNVNEDYVELTYHFEQSDNSDTSYAGNLQVPGKKGWEYLWFRYEDYVDPLSGRPTMVKRPVAAYVEQVYDVAGEDITETFFDLGIGTEPLD